MVKYLLYLICGSLTLASCGAPVVERELPSPPPITPDYVFTTMPRNIAAPVFNLPDSIRATSLRATCTPGVPPVQSITISGREIAIPLADWHKLTSQSDTIHITLQAKIDGHWVQFQPFWIAISPDPIDSHLAYRKIEPGYELWSEMGIYQRNLENYDEKPILTNASTNYGCMNCHSFCQRCPDSLLFHLRVDYAGTYMCQQGHLEKLNTKTPQTVSALVYPYWHPSGRYVAFSTNDTKQVFHTTSPNRIEVYDNASDVVVYDVQAHEIVSSPLLSSEGAFETFPSFSPSGRKLYFCTADAQTMPDDYDRVKYSLCSIDFDSASRQFGTTVDTLYNAKKHGRSISFPRPSPDGRWLMVTLHDYGNFSIWHRDADLYMIDLESGEMHPLEAANSHETESYHSWSGNSRWVVFSSRRGDGLYTRPYIAHIDADGRASKPFPVPQADARYYDRLMKSYNVPELVSGEVTLPQSQILSAANTPGTDIKYSDR